jgi:hypothetical protein
MPGRWSLVLIIRVNGCCNCECQCGIMHRVSWNFWIRVRQIEHWGPECGSPMWVHCVCESGLASGAVQSGLGRDTGAQLLSGSPPFSVTISWHVFSCFYLPCTSCGWVPILVIFIYMDFILFFTKIQENQYCNPIEQLKKIKLQKLDKWKKFLTKEPPVTYGPLI